MAVPPARPKTAVVYTSDEGNTYVYKHCADIAELGGWEAGTGEPHPSKGTMKPRHIGLTETGGSRRFQIPIATKAELDEFTLGQSVSYGGVTCSVSSKVGEKSVNR
jgi:hypothetical protein